MAAKKWKSGEVTLVDLFSLICFLSPLFAGITIGTKAGFIGGLIGLAIGFFLGLMGIVAFRKTVRWLAIRWKKMASGSEAIAFLIASCLWLFGLIFLAFYLTESVVRWGRA